MTLSDAELAKAGGHFTGGEVDMGISVDVTCGGVDQTGIGAEFGDVLEAIGVQGEMIRDVDIPKLGSVNILMIMIMLLL